MPCAFQTGDKTVPDFAREGILAWMAINNENPHTFNDNIKLFKKILQNVLEKILTNLLYYGSLAKMAQSVARHTRNVQVRGSIPRLGLKPYTFVEVNTLHGILYL